MWSALKNASIGIKIALAPAIAVLCLAGVGGIALFANQALETTAADIGDKKLPAVLRVVALDQQVRTIHAKVNQSLAWEGAGFKADRISALDKTIGQSLQSIEQEIGQVAAVARDDDEAKALATLATEFAKYKRNALDALDIKAGGLGNAASYMTTLDGSFESIVKSAGSLIDRKRTDAAAAVAQSRSVSQRNVLAIGSGFALALLTTIGISLLTSRAITRPLTDAARVAREVEGGNLCARAAVEPAGDVTGDVVRALEAVVSNLSTTVSDVRATANLVSTCAGELASGTSDLSVRTEQTASALQETAAAIEELSVTVRSSAEAARAADDLARSASQIAADGNESVSAVVEAMRRIDSHAARIGVRLISVQKVTVRIASNGAGVPA